MIFAVSHCDGDPQSMEDDSVVEFLENAIAVVRQHNVRALWLRPAMNL